MTYDASPRAGADARCAPRVRRAWGELAALAAGGAEARARARRALRLCDGVPLEDEDDVVALRDWLGAAWDYMAMGK